MDQIKFYVKLAGTSLLRWLMLSGIGLVLSIIGIVVGVVLLGNNVGAGYHGGRSGSVIGALVGILTLFQDEFWTALLLVGSVGFVAIYVLVANKISLGFVLSRLFENKLSPIIGVKVSSLVGAFIDRQPGFAKALKGVSTLRGKLIDSAKQDATLNKLQRKVICAGLKKVRLEDIDLQQQNLNLPEVISNRVVQELQAVAEPSYKLFWIAAGAHGVLLVLAMVFDHV
jgi:hypothetical protein